MNKMNTPGFTAAASLYETSNSYGMAATFEAMQKGRTVYPQRVAGPFGPIGLPGQNCGEACLHVCMMTGRTSQECRDSCMNTCTGSPFTAWLAIG
jgi:hypothetical protein